MVIPFLVENTDDLLNAQDVPDFFTLIISKLNNETDRGRAGAPQCGALF
jgi:hypothetical protein